MGKFKDRTGIVYGRLTAVKVNGFNQHGQTLWLCECECGAMHTTGGHHLSNGHVRSCGCLNREAAAERCAKHGMWGTTLYKKWDGMIGRCYRERNQSFKTYGGEGVTVCDEWRKDPMAFISWATTNGWKEGLELDRINNAKIYGPDTCRFVTHLANRQMQRLIRRNNTIGFRGVYKNKKGFMARVYTDGNSNNLGTYGRQEIAAIIRDKFVLANRISHPLNFPELFFNCPA